jgi:hypothetical protein
MRLRPRPPPFCTSSDPRGELGGGGIGAPRGGRRRGALGAAGSERREVGGGRIGAPRGRRLP